MKNFWKGLLVVAGSSAAGSFGATFADPNVWNSNAKGAAAAAGVTVLTTVVGWLIQSPKRREE